MSYRLVNGHEVIWRHDVKAYTGSANLPNVSPHGSRVICGRCVVMPLVVQL